MPAATDALAACGGAADCKILRRTCRKLHVPRRGVRIARVHRELDPPGGLC